MGALLIDITNALVIQDFLGLPGSGTRVHALAVLSTARLTTQDLGEARDGLSIPLHEAADRFLGRR